MAPLVNGSGDNIDQLIADNQVIIFSKSYCPFCDKVKELFRSIGTPYKSVELDLIESGANIQQELANKTGQRTVPNVFVGGQHVGGCDATLQQHADGRLGVLLSGATTQGGRDYDLVVIGGGSGGLAASKEAAQYGRKVAVCDFVKPSPMGTTWGLGGTCVNVGCIPKKLMHQAALLGEALRDARAYGWEVPERVAHSWETMVEAIQVHVKSLNWSYRVSLRENKVVYLNAFAEFIDAHTIKTVDKKGNEKLITADRVLLATGGRPRYPDIAGAKEFCITSDDIFSLPYCPGKTLLVGASYISLECAGFLVGLGLDTTVMVRSILLRGFDQQMAELIGSAMEECGVKFVRQCVPTKIERMEEGSPGRLRVTAVKTDGTEVIEEYNTVLLAIGRDACTHNLGLEKLGVKINPKNGKVVCNPEEQSSVPHIYAIGDILDGGLELTPVAIQAGRCLARRLYGGSSTRTDYATVPTTVFTPLEYGVVGLSEEMAIERFGENDIEVFHQNFTPLEFTVPGRGENSCYIKLVCHRSEDMRVVGLHVLGTNAGEVTQGFTVGLRKGATKKDFDDSIGIHPTNAELFTTMTVSKSSGQDNLAKGC